MRKILGFAFLILCAGNATADAIWLKNGDRINGMIEFMRSDQLIVNTSYAGRIAIQWQDVVTLETSKPVVLTLENSGGNEQGVLDIAEDGFVICKTCAQKIQALASIRMLRSLACTERLAAGPRARRIRPHIVCH